MRIVVKSCATHADREYAQFCTWADRQPEVLFADGQILGVPDDYAHLPHKTQMMCRFIVALKEDFGFFCDTDTFVHVPRLLASGFEKHDYIGHRLDGKDYASGGAGYWLSHKAMKVIAACDPSEFTLEDEMVGTVLARAGIPLHHDPRYTLALDSWPEPGNDLITKHLSMNGPYKVEMMYSAHRRAHP